jgi:hypothetical protein
MTQPMTPIPARRAGEESAGTDPVRLWAWVVAGSVPVIFVVGLILQIVIVDATRGVVNFIGAAFGYSIIGTAVACALVAVGVGKPPRSQRYVISAAVMGALAGLAPISLVVYLRLSNRVCDFINVLGLPWPAPWREVAHVGGGLIWLASTAFLIVAVATPRLRRAGMAMWIWSGIVSIPTVVLFMLIVGDVPASGCTPV